MSFADRRDAGRRLAARLRFLHGEDVVVLALPRGGVPVAFEVAQALDAPLDVVVVRKLGVPFQPELAMGAVGEGGVLVVNDDMPRLAGVTPEELAQLQRRGQAEVDRQARRYRGDRPRALVAGRTAVVVDDGVATGATALAACRVVKAQGAARVVLAVPVAPAPTLSELGREAEVVCLEAHRHLWAVGQWYRDFSQTSDDEVARLLREPVPPSPVSAAADPRGDDPPVEADEVEVVAGHARLAGLLSVPQASAGVVVFAHGSGSSRHSPRNRFVAEVLNRARLATLLVDLLTRDEEQDRASVFDIELLAGRLAEVTGWLGAQLSLGRLPVGYFGASTGAGAALWAAADPGADIAAVVSRGGRPDLAARRLAQVRAPTLLIVGGQDQTVLELNRLARARLRCENRLEVVPGATHLFEEPGALAVAAELARGWLYDHLTASTPSAPRACQPGTALSPTLLVASSRPGAPTGLRASPRLSWAWWGGSPPSVMQNPRRRC
ncbi:MAG TPA: phosphoribosyltransferase [Acidimicrobiales bacterium]|nr:phosphoribosyltransferase [Acidimicrobiales bacterium]